MLQNSSHSPDVTRPPVELQHKVKDFNWNKLQWLMRLGLKMGFLSRYDLIEPRRGWEQH